MAKKKTSLAEEVLNKRREAQADTLYSSPRSSSGSLASDILAERKKRQQEVEQNRLKQNLANRQNYLMEELGAMDMESLFNYNEFGMSDEKREEFSNIISNYRDKYTNLKNITRSISDDDYNTVMSSLDSLSDKFDILSSYESEDAFNQALKYQKDYEDMLSFDTEAGQKELDYLNDISGKIDAIENDVPSFKSEEEYYNIYKRMGCDDEDARSLAADDIERANEILAKRQNDISGYLDEAGYGSSRELKDAIAEKEKYLKKAKRLQAAKDMENTAKNLPEYGMSFDEDEDLNSAFTLKNKSFEEVSNYHYNKVYVSPSSKKKQDGFVGMPMIGSSPDINIDGSNLLYKAGTYMTDEEYAAYRAYVLNGDDASAERYIEALEYSLNERQASNYFTEVLKDNRAAEMIFGLESGLDQFSSGMRSLFNTKGDYITPSATQMASQMVRQDVGGSGWGVAYDVATTTSNMLPSILASTVVGYVNPVAGSVVGSALMGSSAAGNAYQEMLNNGYNKDQARAYAIMTGASETCLQYAIGGVAKLGGKLTGKYLESFAKGLNSASARFAIEYGGEMLSEGMEEFLQDVLDPFFKQLATGEDLQLDENYWSDAIYSGLLGMLTAGILNGGEVVNSVSNKVAEVKTINQIREDGNLQNLIDFGKTFDATTSANKIANKVNENTSSVKLANLLHSVNATLSEQTTNAIRDELVSRGMREYDADTISQWLALATQGYELNKKQINILEKNRIVSGVFRDVVVNQNTTVNQRNNAMRSILGEEEFLNPELNDNAIKESVSNTSEALIGLKQYALEKSMRDIGIRSNFANEEKNSLFAKQSEFAKNSIAANRMDSVHKMAYSKVSAENGIEPTRIVSMDNGKMKLQTKDGSVVDSANTQYKSNDSAFVFEAMKEFKYPTDTANEFVDLIKMSRTDNVDNLLYGMNEAYNVGKAGYALEHYTGGGLINDLTEQQKKTAYNRGRIDASIEAGKKQTIRDNGKGKKIVNKGSVSKEDTSGMTETQKTSYEVAKKVVEDITHNKLEFYESVNVMGKQVFKNDVADFKAGQNAPNGWYDTKTGTIYIDLKAGSSGEGVILFTLAHELTHFISDWSPAKFKKLTDFLMQEYGKNNVPIETLINNQIASAKKNGRTISYDVALEEVVADSMQTMFTDTNLLEKLEKLKAQDKNLFQKIVEFIKDMYAKITKAYEGLDPYSSEAHYVKQMKDSLEKLSDLFAEGLVDAGETFSKTQILPVGNMAIDSSTESVAPLDVQLMSERTWTESDYVKDREKTAKKIAKELGVPIEKAYKYIDDINSVARLIADDRVRLDYEPNLDPGATVLKKNSDYKWSVDMSTLCAKRLLFTGTFDAIQKAMPNTVFDSEDIVKLRKMMEDRDYQVACGICYVESTRREIGRITNEFIERYKLAQKTGEPITRLNSEGKEVVLTSDGNTFKADKNYTPTLGELNTTDIDLVKRDHPEVYGAYLAFMNARGQAKPKLLETRAEYKGEILEHFKSSTAVEARNRAGGLRLQSFSDFEVPHLIDMMQITMDMARKGLKSQAYTKVPAFADAFGNTGIKINLSLIAKGSGLDANGNLIFDDVEGINHEEAFRLRDKYSKNVGTILVGKSDEHIIAAMDDPRIDYIIPFHKSSWKESLYEVLGLTGYDDYTETQNEKPIDKSRKIKNFDPSEYWDFTKTGDENAQIYLEKCREDGRIPKFPQFSSYPGYWKLLIDFKMYDNDGVGSPQEVVRPEFNEEVNKRILDEYKGGHRSFPVAQDVVDDFVKEYKNENSMKLSDRGEFIDSASGENVKFSLRKEEPPKRTIKGYKVFFVKDGKLYPPMVANPNGADTPIGVWLNADIGVQAPDSKTGRKQVKAGGKGTQGGSGSLAFRPGWHLGEIPLATQFDRLNPETGVKELFPENFVWAECDVAADIDYQEEAMSYGYNANGKFQHSLAGLPKLPTDGYYKYRTNPNPDTVPWLITGAMKVNRLLSDAEVNDILAENGIAPKKRQGGDKTLEDLGFIKNSDRNPLGEMTPTDRTERPIASKKEPANYALNSDRDSLGNTLSENQKKFFEKSLARDNNGNLKVYYHGTTSAGFTVFDNRFSDDKRSLFFTDTIENAQSYSASTDEFAPDKNYSFNELSGIIDTYSGGDTYIQKNDGVFSLYEVEMDDDELKISSSDISDIQRYFIDNYMNRGWDYSANIPVYLRLENPLIVDAHNNNWDEISSDIFSSAEDFSSIEFVKDNGDGMYLLELHPVDESEYTKLYTEEQMLDTFGKYRTQRLMSGKGVGFTSVGSNGKHVPSSTRDYSEYAYNKGYDGVIFNNIIDNGLFGNKGIPSQVAIAYDSSRIKSIYNRNPTSREDIRYSNRDAEVDNWLDSLSIDDLIDALDISINSAESKKTERRVDEVNKMLNKIGLEFNGTKTLAWTDERVEKYLDSYASSNPNYAQAYVTYMSPKDFLALTIGSRTYTVDRIVSESEEYGDLDMDKIASSVPMFLDIDEDTKNVRVVGHEGRHRMYLLGKAGVERVPVLLFNYNNKYSKETRENFTLVPQKFFSGELISKGRNVKVEKAIPLSRSHKDEVIREFGSGNQNADVRYSDRDNRYMELAKNPEANEAELRKMIEEVARENGYNSPIVYHGTPNGDFNVFDRDRIGSTTDYGWYGAGFYFSTNENVAKRYAGYLRTSIVKSAYLKTSNPLVISVTDRFEIPRRLADIMGVYIEEFENKKELSLRFAEWIRNSEYDSVIAKKTNEYVVYDPEQIKSADIVTYDDNGNIIPLSERFNKKNPDIRFSSRKEWHTGMTDSEVRMLEKRANEEKSRHGKHISDTDKWLLYNNGKNSYFAIYSINDVNETEGILPTILYASKGNTATNDSKILKQLLLTHKGVTYGRNSDRGTGNTGNIFVRNWDAILRSYLFGDVSVGRGSNKGDVRIPIGNTHYRLQPALRNCLENIFETSIKRSGGLGNIKMSDRDLSFDSRTLLSNALATTAQNDIERKYIEEYQSKIATINEEQNRLTELRAELKELSFAPGKRDMNRINTLRDEATKIANRINVFDKQLLKLQASKPLEQVVERERLKAQRKAAERSREVLENYKNRVSTTAIRNKVKKYVDDFRQRLQNPTERKYIPAKLVSGIVDIYDMIDPTGYKQDSKVAEKYRTTKEALADLKLLYDSLKDESYDFSSEFDEEFSTLIADLAEAVGDTPLRDMNREQLEDVYDIIHDISAMITDATKQIGTDEAITNYQAGQELIADMKKIKDLELDTNKLSSFFREWTLNPMRAVKEMSGYRDDARLVKLFNDLNNGRIKADKFKMDTTKKFESIMDGEGRKAFNDAVEKPFDFGIVDVDGNPVMISKMQAMQAILTYRRETANKDRRHLETPVRFTDVRLDVKGKYGQAFDNGHDVLVDDGFVNRVMSRLSEWDMKYLDLASQFFNVDSKNAVNETTIITKHRPLAMEKEYIPYYVNQDYIQKESDNLKFDSTIEGMGMLKAVRNNAPQQLVIRGLNSVIDDHMNKVAKVYGLQIPVRNFNKVFNMIQTREDGGSSVKTEIRKPWGDNGLKLISQAVADLQSNRRTDTSKFLNSVKSAFVTSTLASNISVTVKQAASYPTAGAILKGSALVKALPFFARPLKSVWEEIDEHTPQHWLRRQGLSTQELGDINQSHGLINKLNHKLGGLSPMNWIQAVDVKTTAVLWIATKYDVESRGFKKGTEEYWSEVEKTYNKVLEDTQPMYDSLHRAEITKGGGFKNIIMFQTQPIQNSGILREGAMQYKMMKKQFGKNSEQAKSSFKKFRSAVESQMASHLVFTMMTLFAASLLHRMNPWRDDDEELTTESVIKEFAKEYGSNFFSAVVPIFGSYAVTAVEKMFDGNGYDVLSDPTIDKINTTIELFNRAKKNHTLNDFISMASDVASYFGIPAGNVRNIINGARLHIEDAKNGKFGSFEAGVERSKKQEVHRSYEAYTSGNMDKFDSIEVSQGSVTSYLKPIFLDAYKRNDTSTMATIRKYMKATNVYKDDIVKVTQAWIKNMNK